MKFRFLAEVIGEKKSCFYYYSLLIKYNSIYQLSPNATNVISKYNDIQFTMLYNCSKAIRGKCFFLDVQSTFLSALSHS